MIKNTYRTTNKVFRGLHDNIITYNSLFDALCKNCHLDRATALFNKTEDQGIQPNILHIYNIY